MNDYIQPGFYRFNEDSLKLVKWVLSQKKTADRVLDMGAGCGVIGLELAKVLCPHSLTLLEFQQEYRSYLEKNIELFSRKGTEYSIEMKSFKEWVPQFPYDLIVCNPPYYLPGHGEKNKDARKEIARSFIVDGWAVLLDKISDALSENGRAYLVIKNDKRTVAAINDTSCPLQKNFHESGQLLFLELLRLNKD